jgi:long-subunit acyl-CoA synthetase (AMP-forming)
MYGLSETTGSTTAQNLTNLNLKSAGRSMTGGVIKISNPNEKGEGEIRIKGR